MRYYFYLVIGVLACLPRLALTQNNHHLDHDDVWQDVAGTAMQNEEWDDALDILQPLLENSPNDLDARLLRAICYREKARHVFNTLRSQFFLGRDALKETREVAAASASGRQWQLETGGKYDVTQAIFDFEYIVSRDSGYREVLIEYARLWHDHNVFDLAISLAESQLELDVDAPRVYEELIASYRHYIAWAPRNEAMETFLRTDSPYARYFTGEVFRRKGRMERADSIFAALYEQGTLPKQPILLSRARIAIAQGRYEAAHTYIENALDFNTILGARLLLPDFTYVMDESEYLESKSLQTAEEFRDFYARMWTRRNPIPAARLNWRLIEHFRRLVIAERDYEYFGPRVRRSGPHHDANRLVDPAGFPTWYWRVHGFSDKGLIYIRHGEPDDRIVTQPKPGIGMNESWRYRAEGLDFHFFISETDGVAYSWPLVPVLTNCYMAYDRREWGGYYNQLAPPPQFVNTGGLGFGTDACGPDADPRNNHDVNIATSYLSDQGNADIARGLTTDRHTWIEGQIEGFEIPFDIATFRGSDGLSDVMILLALPVGYFGEVTNRDTLTVEIGYSLHDTAWRPAVSNNFRKRYGSNHNPSAATFEEVDFRVPPDSYHVALHADLLGSRLLSGYQLDRRIPDYDRNETMMSDLVLAYDIRPKPGHSPSRRSSLQITANPFHRFGVDQIVHVYFEIYRLTLNENDKSIFEVTYAVEPERERGGLPGLVRGKSRSLSVSSSFEELTPSPVVISEIDVSDLEPGNYTLSVRVRDPISGVELTRSTPLELTRSDPN